MRFTRDSIVNGDATVPVSRADPLPVVQDGCSARAMVGSAASSITISLPVQSGKYIRVWGYSVKTTAATTTNVVDIVLNVGTVDVMYDGIPAGAAIGTTKTVIFTSPIQADTVGTSANIYASSPGGSTVLRGTLLYDYF